MIKTILVPTDDLELSDKAVLASVDFAKACDGKIIGLALAQCYSYSLLAEPAFFPDPANYDKGMLELAEIYVAKVKAAAVKASVPCETLFPLRPALRDHRYGVEARLRYRLYRIAWPSWNPTTGSGKRDAKIPGAFDSAAPGISVYTRRRCLTQVSIHDVERASAFYVFRCAGSIHLPRCKPPSQVAHHRQSDTPSRLSEGRVAAGPRME